MDSTYTRLVKSLHRIRRGNTEQLSLFIGVIVSILAIPLIFLIIGVPTYIIGKQVVELGFIHWIRQVNIDSLCIWTFILGIIYMAGISVIIAIISGFSRDIKMIFLFKKLEAFNAFWEKEHLKIQNIDEILTGVESIHLNFNKLPILKQYILSKDSKYLFLQKMETAYFIEILTDLRSDLATRLTEQRQILEGAKTKVENTITGTPELIAVSEAQQVRLDRQIEQFEELQRVLVRV